MTGRYDELKRIANLQREGKLDPRASAEQRIDWAYGNTKLENDEITREVVEKAAHDYDRRDE